MMKKVRPYSLLNYLSLGIAVIWGGTLVGSLLWNLHLEKHQTEAVAKHVAKAYFDKDLALRLWGAKHGGVYAPISKESPANPYLSHVAERDIETPSGKKLTLINPAYMIRQMMAEFSELTGVSGHLTSLQLLNPINKPDAWEEKNLKVFEDGIMEVTSFVEMDGKLSLRMMRPFIIKKPCLKCHAQQGFKVGEIKGATSMSIPMEPYLIIGQEMRQRMFLSHLLILLFGFLGIGLGYFHIRKNITQHLALERDLKTQNEFTHTIIESLTHPFMVFDANSYIIEMANSAALGDATLNGQTCYSLSHHKQTPCKGDEHPCPIALLKETKNTVTVEHVHIDSTGQERNVELHCYPLLDTNGEVIKVVEYAVDITDRRAIEKDKLKLQVRLQQSQKMESIGTLAGGIAHDFNNILSAIFGYNQLAMMNIEQPDKLRQNLEQVQLGSERARELVKQILTFSRSAEHEKQPLQVSLVVKEALKMLRSAIPTTIAIEEHIDSQGVVLADPTQIHQIVMNLCTNAYHAMRETGGTLGVSLQDVEITDDTIPSTLSLASGMYLKLEVSDTGSGIDPKTLEKIFEPYFTTKMVGEGTGLGLAVVHGIVKDFNGQISVSSEQGSGTTFRVFLPKFDGSSNEYHQGLEKGPLVGGAEKIMIIDDEENIVNVIAEILTKYGYTVFPFTNGVQALSDFKKNPESYDLIITDMTMPYMTGTELAQKLIEIRPNIAIILCTGHSELTNKEKAKSIGIKDFLQKPISMDLLVRDTRRVLDKQIKAEG